MSSCGGTHLKAIMFHENIRFIFHYLNRMPFCRPVMHNVLPAGHIRPATSPPVACGVTAIGIPVLSRFVIETSGGHTQTCSLCLQSWAILPKGIHPPPKIASDDFGVIIFIHSLRRFI